MQHCLFKKNYLQYFFPFGLGEALKTGQDMKYLLIKFLMIVIVEKTLALQGSSKYYVKYHRYVTGSTVQ